MHPYWLKLPPMVFTSILAGLAYATSAQASTPYAKVVVFGDSLSDAGHFRYLSPPALQTIAGRFTTNPGWVWAEHVAHHYRANAATDNTGGDNYAQGGARTVSPNGGPDPTVSQLHRYLSSLPAPVGSDDLYMIWSGTNDIFAIRPGGQPEAAVLEKATQGISGMVSQLSGAGARYILVANIPDLGLIPYAIQTETAIPGTRAEMTRLSDTLNNRLFTRLGQSGYRVIPLDTFHLLQEVAADPQSYGFSHTQSAACRNATGPLTSLNCTPASYAAPGADHSYLFADAVHPTTAFHQLLGDYALSILEAPRLQQQLPLSAVSQAIHQADQVAQHLEQRPAAGWHWWGGVQETGRDNNSPHIQSAPAGLAGIDWVNGAWAVGGFVGAGRARVGFGQEQGGFTQSATTLGLSGGWYDARAWLNVQVSYSWLSYDVRRRVRLGPAVREHQGDTTGSNIVAAIQAGYEWGEERGLRYGPLLALTSQTVQLKSYLEEPFSATALGYPNQHYDYLQGRAGLQLRYEGDMLAPYVQIHWNHSFRNLPKAKAWSRTLPQVGEWQVPGLATNNDQASFAIGLRARLWGLRPSIGLSAEHGNLRDPALSLGISGTL